MVKPPHDNSTRESGPPPAKVDEHTKIGDVGHPSVRDGALIEASKLTGACLACQAARSESTMRSADCSHSMPSI